MSKEYWKDIPGYEGEYQASTEGRIRSLDRTMKCHYKNGKVFYRKYKGKILKPGQYCKCGHVSVVLHRGSAGKSVHKLVMKTFIGETPKGMEILHKNGNPKDNRLVNLRYGTRTENIIDVYRQGKCWRKLDVEDVLKIRFGIYCEIKNIELAEMFDVSTTTISNIKKRRNYSWLK